MLDLSVLVMIMGYLSPVLCMGWPLTSYGTFFWSPIIVACLLCWAPWMLGLTCWKNPSAWLTAFWWVGFLLAAAVVTVL